MMETQAWFARRRNEEQKFLAHRAIATRDALK